MDVLSNILGKVRLTSAVYFKSDFASPWGMDIQEGPFAQFHIVTRGQCLLKTGDRTTNLFSGDIVVFPFGASHWLADKESSRRQLGQEVVTAILNEKSLFEGPNVSTTLVCGHFEFDRNMDHPLINELPGMIHIPDSERQEKPWLEGIANLVVREVGHEEPGSHIIVNKLGEILFVYILRAFILRNAYDKGFLAALQDDQINNVLKAIHDVPQRNWKLSSLAQIGGLSRTGFSNRFKELVGETALSYVTKWRISLAKELLKEGKETVGEVAEKVGYRSEAAFNRIFKRTVAQTPLKYRQAQRG